MQGKFQALKLEVDGMFRACEEIELKLSDFMIIYISVDPFFSIGFIIWVS